LYEHEVFVEGVFWGIDIFDLWGGELGKLQPLGVAPLLTAAEDPAPPAPGAPGRAVGTRAVRVADPPRR
uniref:hypothetical protein n=1 Tax=Nocardia farcinica TaxID=37329 RepID=UPI0024544E09